MGLCEGAAALLVALLLPPQSPTEAKAGEGCAEGLLGVEKAASLLSAEREAAAPVPAPALAPVGSALALLELSVALLPVVPLAVAALEGETTASTGRLLLLPAG